jgi:hypothetical protein
MGKRNGHPESQALLINVDDNERSVEAHDDLHSGGAGFLAKGGANSAVYTLCSMSLGVGVFVLPIVFKDLGSLSGVSGIVFCARWGYWRQVRVLYICV